jgi:uncharacterized membrane protein YdbT with pleckstrin-like domain
MDLHPGETVVFEGHPSWRAAPAFYLKGMIPVLVLAVVVWIAGEKGAAVIAFVVGALLVVLAGVIRRSATRYVITTERLHIRKGLLSRHVQQTTIDRVQNVNTDQSFLERVLKVGRVDFDTAGTEEDDFTFRGISRPDRIVAAIDTAQRAHRADTGV